MLCLTFSVFESLFVNRVKFFTDCVRDLFDSTQPLFGCVYVVRLCKHQVGRFSGATANELYQNEPTRADSLQFEDLEAQLQSGSFLYRGHDVLVAVTDDRDQQIHQNNDDRDCEEPEDDEFQPIVVVNRIGQVTEPEDAEVLGKVPEVFFIGLTVRGYVILVVEEILLGEERDKYNDQEWSHSLRRRRHNFVECTETLT